MNIRHRTYTDEPHPFRSGGQYEIDRISLRVARKGSLGRFEAYTNSRDLFARLDAIGKAGLDITAMNIGGAPVGAIPARALSLYISSAKGLKYFRRVAPFGSTKGHLASLLSRVGINYHQHVTRPQPTSEVPAGPIDPPRSAEDCRLSQIGRGRFQC